MSLHAKLEAVIYAAEEPVTLTQLAALFSEEALQWKAEQEAAFRALQVSEPQEPVLTIGEGVVYLGAEQTAAPEESLLTIGERTIYLAAEQTDESDGAAGSATEISAADAPQGSSPASDAVLSVSVEAALLPIVVRETEPAAASGAESQSAPQNGPEAPGLLTPPDPESESKRAARIRDRDVKAVLRQILDELMASFAADGRGIEIREIAGGFRMATKPECHDAVRLFIKSQKPPLKLSLPALETLAVIAYKQPVTAPEVNEIRGVESGGVLGSLLSRKLIATAGRKQVIGRPILYKTTKEFLLRFGLKDISELPSMEEFEKIAAVELSETEETPETPEAAAAAEGGLPPGSGPELDENASEDETAAETQASSVAATAAPESQAASAEPEPVELPASEAATVPGADHGSEGNEDAPDQGAVAETIAPAGASEPDAASLEGDIAEPAEAESANSEELKADAEFDAILPVIDETDEAEPASPALAVTPEAETTSSARVFAEPTASKQEAEAETAPHD